MKAALLALLLAGCASMPEGVTMTEADKATCKKESCTVWSEKELNALIMLAIEQGYKKGLTDAKGSI